MAGSGIVKFISGSVKAIAIDGTERVLLVGDRVFQNEQIITGDIGMIAIEFSDGRSIDIGRSATITLNDDTLGLGASAQPPGQTLEDARDEVATIQKALEDGEIVDPSKLDAPAAGGAPGEGAGENEGHSHVSVEYNKPAVTPDSGFETKGINVSFPEPEEELILDSVSTPNEVTPNSLPTTNPTAVLLDEDDISPESFNADFNLIRAAFEGDTGYYVGFFNDEGVNDEAPGDDLPVDSPSTQSGFLNADFGNDGSGAIAFNAASLQPAGLTSGGENIHYWVSADGYSLVAYIITEQAVQSELSNEISDYYEQTPTESVVKIIFTAEITDVNTGAFRTSLYGPIDHEDGTTEDNLLINLGYTISDSNGDTAQGILGLNVDDDSPIITEARIEGGIQTKTMRIDEDDLPYGNNDFADGDDGSGPTLLFLPVNFGADGPAENDAIALSPEGIVDQRGNALSSNGIELQYSWDSENDVLIGYTDSIDSPVLTIAVTALNQNGANVSVELLGSLDHPVIDTEDNLVFNVSYIVTDRDGDSVNGRFTVDVDDDSPTIIATQPTEVSYELVMTNHDEVSSAGYHNSFGYYVKDADGNPTTGVVVWDDVHDADATTMTVTGLTPDQIGFFIIPNGDNKNPGLNDETEVTFNQLPDGTWAAFINGVQLVGHNTNAPVLFDNTELNPDAYGYAVDSGLIGNLNWEDIFGGGDRDNNDVNINVEWNEIRPLTVDESELGDSDSSVVTMLLDDAFDISPGADGLESVVYQLGLPTATEGQPNPDSGLNDSLTGGDVLLRMNGNTVEGYVGEDVVFSLVVDANGEATLTQFRSVMHDDPNDPDESISPAVLDSGLIALTAIATDGDGDTARDSIDMGLLIAFEDDGPSASDGSIDLQINPITTNLAVIVDISKSMTDEDLALTREAIDSLIDQYDDIGHVNVNIIQFYANGYIDSTWVSAEAGKGVVLDTTKSGTDIEQGLRAMVENSYSGNQPGADQDIMYFFGDGDTYSHYKTDFDAYLPSWNSFVNSGQIDKLFSYSVNTTTVKSDIDKIADNGENSVSEDAVNITDIAGLEAEIGETVNVYKSGSLTNVIDFGADDGHVQSITIGETEIFYDADNITQTVEGTHGKFEFNFDSGEFKYLPTDYVDHTEHVSINVVDNDGDSLNDVLFDINIAFTEDQSLIGSGIDDVLLGGVGNDILVGAGGNDILTGAEGNDRFIWNKEDVGSLSSPAHDAVTDFDVDNDILDLVDLLSDGSHSIEGISIGSSGSEHLQINVVNSSDHIVQEIELGSVMLGSDISAANDMLDTLLASGAIESGI
jgi:T1SS-143 domain-containing protein